MQTSERIGRWCIIVILLCLWLCLFVLRATVANRIDALERRLQAIEAGIANAAATTQKRNSEWAEFWREMKQRTNIIVQQDATGSRNVRWPTNRAEVP